MLKHLVFWKLKEPDNIEKAYSQLLNYVPVLMQDIKELEELSINMNTIPIEGNFDIVLSASFQNEEALKIYASHSTHVAFAKFIKTITVERAAIDFYTV